MFPAPGVHPPPALAKKALRISLVLCNEKCRRKLTSTDSEAFFLQR